MLLILKKLLKSFAPFFPLFFWKRAAGAFFFGNALQGQRITPLLMIHPPPQATGRGNRIRYAFVSSKPRRIRPVID